MFLPFATHCNKAITWPRKKLPPGALGTSFKTARIRRKFEMRLAARSRIIEPKVAAITKKAAIIAATLNPLLPRKIAPKSCTDITDIMVGDFCSNLSQIRQILLIMKVG